MASPLPWTRPASRALGRASMLLLVNNMLNQVFLAETLRKVPPRVYEIVGGDPWMGLQESGNALAIVEKLSIVDTCVHFLWKRSSTFSRFWKGSWNQKILRTLSLWRYCCQSEFCTPELCLSSQVGSLAPLHLEQAAVGDDCLLCSANRLIPALLPQSSPNMLRYAWTL